MDSFLACLSPLGLSFLQVDGAEEAQRRVPSLGIVVSLQIFKKRRLNGQARLQLPTKEHFLLERAEKALSDGVVPAVALATHAESDDVPFAHRIL